LPAISGREAMEEAASKAVSKADSKADNKAENSVIKYFKHLKILWL